MNSYEAAVAREVGKLLDEELRRLTEDLIEGAAKDYADYQFRIGQIRMLQQMQQWLHDIEREMRS